MKYEINPSKPLTIDMAEIKPGDILEFADGKYDHIDLIDLKGTEFNPIIVRAKSKHGVDTKYVWLHDSHHVIIDGFYAHDSGIGLRVGRDNPKECKSRTTDIMVLNCKSERHNWWGMGISGCPEYPTENIIVDSCIITDTAKAEGNGHNIKLSSWVKEKHSKKVLIKNCEIARAWYHGIQCSQGWDNVNIRRCKIYDNGTQRPGDFGGIRFGTTVGAIAEYNELYGAQRSFYLQEYPSMVYIRKNYIHDSVMAFYLRSVNGSVYINDNWLKTNKEDLVVSTQDCVMKQGEHFHYADNIQVSARPAELDNIVIPDEPIDPPVDDPVIDPPVTPPAQQDISGKYKIKFEGTVTIERED